MVKKPEEQQEDKYKLQNVATETGMFIKDIGEDKILDDKEVLERILNYLEKIHRSVC